MSILTNSLQRNNSEDMITESLNFNFEQLDLIKTIGTGS